MECFEEIYKTYFSRVYSFLYKMCADPGLAEELTQETFFQAFRGFHRFRGDCEVFTWIAAIAKHVYFKYLKKNKLGQECVSLDAIVDSYCVGAADSAETAAERAAVVQAIHGMIDRIPEKYKDVVVLRIFGQLPFSQVAAALGISEGSAKVIFFRARKMLMEEIKNEFKL